MATYSAAMGLSWAVPTQLQLKYWTPEKGAEEYAHYVTYSRQGPHYVEIQAGAPGSFYDAGLRAAIHIGLWTDDIAADTDALVRQGWQLAIAGASPDDGYGTFSYLSHADGDLMVELVSTQIKPQLEAWIGGTSPLNLG